MSDLEIEDLYDEHDKERIEFVKNMKRITIGTVIEFNATLYASPVHNGYIIYPKYSAGAACWIPY